jgi:hypothetical protein
MMLLDLLRHLPLFGFGIRSVTAHIHRDDTPKAPPFWYLHGR